MDTPPCATIPRTIAEQLGALYRDTKAASVSRYSVGEARKFLANLKDNDWEVARPNGAPLSGGGYRRVWEVLSGEAV